MLAPMGVQPSEREAIISLVKESLSQIDDNVRQNIVLAILYRSTAIIIGCLCLQQSKRETHFCVSRFCMHIKYCCDYFFFHVLLKSNISIGKISSLPASISAISTILDIGLNPA